MKQVICIRHDLKMRLGKAVAQGAHASMGAVLRAGLDDPRVQQWLAGSFTKICVRVDSLEELVELREQADFAGLINCFIVDNGLTEFHGVPTPTALAIGPDTPENLHPITGGLKLL